MYIEIAHYMMGYSDQFSINEVPIENCVKEKNAWQLFFIVCRVPGCFNHTMSQRLGRTSAKEQYSYIFRYTVSLYDLRMNY